MNDNELLRRYVEEQSETAFAELTRRHLHLVYSAALRQMGGKTHAAEDVSQTVFLNVAGNARSLMKHTSLTGWLFTATRYTAMNYLRAEARRRAREQAAELPAEQQSDNEWRELCPVLDEAMHALGERDREALLLRFFEGEPLRTIGARCGITENAARMRVERAVEKLRGALKKRGVMASAAGLAALLSTRSITAAPAALVERIGARIPFAGTMGANSIGIRFWTARAVAISLTLLFCATLPLWYSIGSRNGARPQNRSENARISETPTADTIHSPPMQTTGAASLEATSASVAIPSGPWLELLAVSADTGEPIAQLALELIATEAGKRKRTAFATSDRGSVRIPYSTNFSTFDLSTRGDGYAITRLLWHLDRGAKIPDRYTLRLSRPVRIGGTVLDPDGAPVPDAEVSFGHSELPELAGIPESHSYLYAETKTDSAGRWELNRIAPEMLALSYGSARHAEYVDSANLELKEDPETIRQLTNQTHLFRLGRTIAVKGFVLDERNEPIPGAKVTTDHYLGGSLHRSTRTDENGSFLVLNVAPGRGFLTAEAEGYAPVSMQVEFKDTDGSREIRLSRGKTLRMRVVDPQGNGISGARLWLEQFHPTFGGKNAPQSDLTRMDLTLITGADGRVIWTNAPDAMLSFSPSAEGYMSVVGTAVRPSEEEHVFTLEYALTIRGTVHDSSGNPIPRYRIGVGWPESLFATNRFIPRWSEIDRFWIAFDQPGFKHTLEEPAILSPKNPGYFFKFEADGFVPFVSRKVDARERDVTFDVVLQRSRARKLHIIDVSGQPVPGIAVIFLPEGRFVTATPEGFGPMLDTVREIRTDMNGDVPLQVDPEFTRVLAVCPAGTLNVETSRLPADGVLRLTPWGEISGQLLRDGTASAGETLILARAENLRGRNAPRGTLPPLMFNIHPVRTDSEGLFAFTNVPPGESFVIVVRHKLAPDGKLLEAVHEWKRAINIQDSTPIALSIDLPESGLSKPVLRTKTD